MYLNHDGKITPQRPQCALIHRRLAVIDPDPRSLQPFDDGSNAWWLVYNGEIYNFRELQAELKSESPGIRWRTTGDTEVLLQALRTQGPEALSRLNGMFALAAWDQRNGELLLARDRMGQKPLFIAAVDRDGAPWSGLWQPRERWNADPVRFSPPAAVAFASELHALRVVPWVEDAVDLDTLVEYFRYGTIGAPRTVFRGCGKLLPGSWMRVSSSQAVWQRYYNPNEPEPTSGLAHRAAMRETPVQKVRRLVISAVRRQLVADVPVGCFLSGGIDSSVVACAMRQLASPGQEVRTFSIGFDDGRYDETRYAQAVARRLRTNHLSTLVRPDAATDLQDLARVFGEPFADSSALPTHYLSKFVRQHVKVALSGDGADELFGGYDRYRAARLAARLASFPAPARLLVGRWWNLVPGTHPKSRLARVKRFARSVREDEQSRYLSYLRLMTDAQVQGLFAGGFQLPQDPFPRLYAELRQSRDVMAAALALDRISYLPDDLLVKLDRASMLHALEVRSPFMDHELVTFAAGLDSGQLFRGRRGKILLRQAFEQELPPEVLRRGKMGFALPIGDWFRGSLRDMLRDTVLGSDSFTAQNLNPEAARGMIERHESRKADLGAQLYALLMLELWWKS
jgi:asparagine synthase (glutamine-hydrolysing)